MNGQDKREAQIAANNKKVAGVVSFVVVAMVGLAFAAVPLYDAFCRITGYGGTPIVAESSTGKVLNKTVRVRFNADTHQDLVWEFGPKQRFQTLKLGEQKLAYYVARNPADKATSGQAGYNVSPPKVGQYFNKIDCFCFTEQKLRPGESMDMPVLYFIDPAFADDPEMADVREITLSYIFYALDDGEDDQLASLENTDETAE